MTIDEAIEEFKQRLAIPDYKEQIPEYYEATELAINALEKQILKKPIIEYEQTHDCVTEVEWKCPICGTNYIELAPCMPWCHECGQKFDWGDEK